MSAYSVMKENIDSGKYKSDARGHGNFLFGIDLKVAYGFENHPKFDKALAIAWDIGHAYGLAEVLAYFDEIAELLRD